MTYKSRPVCGIVFLFPAVTAATEVHSIYVQQNEMNMKKRDIKSVSLALSSHGRKLVSLWKIRKSCILIFLLTCKLIIISVRNKSVCLWSRSPAHLQGALIQVWCGGPSHLSGRSCGPVGSLALCRSCTSVAFRAESSACRRRHRRG